jgi:PAS domain S-box-containing protein
VNLPDLDLATMRASPRQRRAAILAIVALGVVALAAAPFARVVLGTFPGMVALYGGAVFTGLAMTATVLFAQFTVTRKPSLLALACGTIFSVVVFVPHILTFPSGTGSQLLPGFPNTSAYLWALWHTVFPASFVAYAIAAQREGTRRVRRGSATIVVLLTLLAAYVCIALVFRFGEILPPLVSGDHYRTGVYAALGVVVVLAGTAIVMLLRRAERTVVDAWLMVPAAAMMIEALVNALGGTRYTVGWYLSRIDIVIATTFLVVALLLETNRLSHFLARSERRLRGIVNGVTDALIVVDLRGAVVSVNPAAASLFGFAAEDLTGTPISRLVPEFASLTFAPDATVVETEGRNLHDNVFPIELARGRDTARELGETILIVRDITQRKSAEEAIRAAHDRAIEAADVKAQFLATMSHEIRTPINAVVGMSELLMQTELSDEARDYAMTVRDSAESLLAIVNDILDFSKIEAGGMDLEAVPFSPVVAVENATDILAAAARKKGLSLSTYVAPDVPRRVIGDADRLRQVLLNLLGNAVKFTAGGSVTVRAVVDHIEGDDAFLHFSVTDTGPGIAPAVAERLFEPFRQADQSTRRRYGGTGLGLSISRRIVELMGGRIGFDSSLGRGSTFWFTIPLPRVLEDEREAADALRGMRILVVDEETVARQVVDQYLLAWGAVASSTANAAHAFELARAMASRHSPFDAIVVDRRAAGDAYAFATRMRTLAGLEKVPMVLITGAEEASTAVDARARGFAAVVRKPIRQAILHDALVAAIHGTVQTSPRPADSGDLPVRHDTMLILIAEDNPVNRKLALQQLKKIGYSADAVTNGREAIDAVGRGDYDLVLMDCQMPDVDGFEATREIRRIESGSGKHIPIVAMTANALEGDREECLAAGMDDYLAKPVQLAALRAAVERYVNGIGVAG